MGSGAEGMHLVTLRDYLRVVRRRKWIIVVAVVLVPFAAVAFSLRQPKLYQASAQVLLSSQNLAAVVTGVQLASAPVAAQAEIAHVPAVAERAVKALPGSGVSAGELLADTSIWADPNTNILTVAVTFGDPSLASRLANAYAYAYTVYRRHYDTAAIDHALAGIDSRLSVLAKSGKTDNSVYSGLVDRQQTLQTLAALQTSNASLLQRAGGAVQTQPHTKRNALLGVLLGIVLGVVLAFLREALDTRVRNTGEIGELLGGLPLLARVPAPDRKLRAERRLVMLRNPGGTQAEIFRMLRTNLDFALLEREIRTIMITSAAEQEGKSTTIANLAIALARTGKRVVLVDLDLRRPFLERFFDLGGPGITQVALGHATLDRALVPLAVGGGVLAAAGARNGAAHVNGNGAARANGNGNGNGNGHGNGHPHGAVGGILEVLPAGPLPPDPGEFVGSEALSEILAKLRERADVVLIDAPPLLRVGDAATLSMKVDGIMLAVRVKGVRRSTLHELRRRLATLPTRVLGVVLTGAGDTEGVGFADGYDYSYVSRPAERREPGERVRGES